MTGPDGGDTAPVPDKTEPAGPAPDAASAGQPRAPRPSPTSRARRIGGMGGIGGTARPTVAAGSRPDAAAAGSAEVDLAKRERLAPAAADPVAADPKAADPAAAADSEADSTSGTGAATESGPAGTEVPGWLRWLPATALGAAAVVMLIFFAVAAHGVWWGQPSTNAVRDQVLSAAKSCMVATNTWHYTTLAADEAKGAACTTGARTTDYRKGMDNVVKKLAVKAKATQVAQVNEAGIVSVAPGGTSWTVLVVGQLDIRQASDPKGRTDPFAAIVQMEHVGGRWLMSRLQEVAGPSS